MSGHLFDGGRVANPCLAPDLRRDVVLLLSQVQEVHNVIETLPAQSQVAPDDEIEIDVWDGRQDRETVLKELRVHELQVEALSVVGDEHVSLAQHRVGVANDATVVNDVIVRKVEDGLGLGALAQPLVAEDELSVPVSSQSCGLNVPA